MVPAVVENGKPAAPATPATPGATNVLLAPALTGWLRGLIWPAIFVLLIVWLAKAHTATTSLLAVPGGRKYTRKWCIWVCFIVALILSRTSTSETVETVKDLGSYSASVFQDALSDIVGAVGTALGAVFIGRLGSKRRAGLPDGAGSR